MEDRNFYPLEKVFNRIIDHQKLPSQYFQSYSKVWNSFSKWARSQIQQDRIILVSDFIQFTSHFVPEDNAKEPIICILEKFLIKNSMEMEDKVDLSYPTVKLNIGAVAKLAELEKQATEIILDNIFEQLKKIISENPKDLLIDLSLFGRLKIRDRKIIHTPLEKGKSGSNAPYKKTTIRSLLSKEPIPKKLPTLNDSTQNLPKLEGSFNDSFSKYQMDKPPLGRSKLSGTEKGQRSGLNHSIVEKLSEKFRINEEGEEHGQLESPTRRFKKHPITMKKQMLGAGLDPLNKEQDFSVLAKTGKNLMAAHFVKPSATKTRYPPIINAFSRTLASPICSSPFPLPLPHRIGSNLSLKCVGLYIHPDKKCLMYENTYLHGFETASQYKEELAAEKEEIIYGQMLLNEQIDEVKKLTYRDKKQLETKILRKKQVYERYISYISNQIDSSHIANIKAVWIDSVINNITAFNEVKPYQEEIPDFTILETDIAESIIHENLEQVVNDYYRAMKKSITDYILLDENERKRLAIKMAFKPVIFWGTLPSKQEIVPYEERQQNDKNRDFLTSDLVLCSSVTWSILHSWEIDFKDRCKLLNLPQKGAPRVTIAQFIKAQIDSINQAKNIFLHEFCKVVAQKYDKQIQSFNGNEFYIKKFCETNATLLSNIIRQLIYAAIQEYKIFLLSFANKELRPVKVIIEDERNNPVHYQFEDAFLIDKMLERDGTMFYEDTVSSIKDALLKIFDQLIRVSHQLSRPETTLRKSEKQFLPEMTLEDEKYRGAQSELSPVLNKLLEPLTVAAGEFEVDYNEYIQLKEAQFVKHNPTIKKIQQQFQRIDGMVQDLNLLPFYTVARFVEIDFRDLRRALKKKVDDYREGIIHWAYEGMIKNCEELFKQIQGSLETIRMKPQDSEKLVELEKYILKIEKELDKRYKAQFQGVKNWFKYLYEIQHPFTQENYQSLHKTGKILFSLPNEVQAERNRIEEERADLEDKVSKMIDQQHSDIVTLLSDISELKKFTLAFQMEEANAKVDQLLARISNFKETKEIINHDIVTLEMGQEIDFPKLETAQMQIEPYVDLWRMVRQFQNYNATWTKTPVFELDPELIQRQIKQMNSKTIKLTNRFNSMAPSSRNEKNKKNSIEGPLKMLEWSASQVKDYQKFTPLCRVFSNPGMKRRHWEQVSQFTHFPVSTDIKLLKSKLMSIEEIFDHLNELELISQNAEKQFGIEKIIKKMEDDWAPVEVELKKWRDTGTFIVAGASIDQMQQILDDQIVKTQTMKGSPYAKIFEQKIKDWEDWLLYTLNFSEYWVKVQSVWLYLEPIFSSPDIKKHLPVEATDFGNVDMEWKTMMAKIVEDTKVINFTNDRSFLETLKDCQNTLDRVQRGLNDYLEGKRAAFPRFYFLSNDELLEILSETKDPTRVQPHLKKCFEGIQKLKFDDSKKIYGMYSSEGQYVKFLSIVDTNAANGNVDQWLLMVESVMIDSVREVTTKAFEDYPNIKRTQWVRDRCGMAVLCIAMTFWTYNSEDAIEGGADGLEKYLNKLNFQLSEIVEITRSDISTLDRATIEALIVLDVHNRDMIGQLKAENVFKTSQFAWQSQLRYYWENNNSWVRMINATLHYNYEYLGNSSRLVITPLTDRCYRTLCGALNLNYGGAPEGPAGTGKTQTVKDLAKALARQCVVFNCSDGLDYRAMGKFFKGLASSGAWSCFDEFNRIDLEVLSVVAQQILTITIARKEGKKIFFFEDADIPLKATCNVFITMNPGYAGRSQLPDNLKALFRAVAMMVPDYTMIAEISLYSFGFNDARNLARKITTTYTLCSEQLSSQDHYDYGMRAVKSVITAAGNLKRKLPNENESILMLRAINEVNLAKFLAFDLPLFKGITSDLFPGVVIPEIDYKNMFECIEIKLKEMNLQKTEYFTTKIIQLYEMILVRHGLMVVGWPFSGKTSCIKALAGALTLLKERGQMNENKTQITIVNPKSISMKQLYGFNDEISHEWTDGVLAVKFRQFAKAEDPNRKWLIFDGPVDAVWIENMNTVLDDNKKLCLNSGQIIAMNKSMNLIFEPMDLQAASPATVSRCGMVYMQPKSLGWRVILDSWIDTLPETLIEEDRIHIRDLILWVTQHLLDYIRSHIEQSSSTQDQNLLLALLKLFRSLLKDFESPDYYSLYNDSKSRYAIVEGKFVFSLVWSFGASADTANRKKIETEIKKILSGSIPVEGYDKKRVSFPDRNSLFDYNYTEKRGSQPGSGYEWILWTDYIDLNEKIPKSALPQQIIVKTNDSVRYSHLLKIYIENKIPLLFCGPTGTGKSIYIKNFILNELSPEKYTSIEMGFSAQTSSMQTQEIIDGKLDKIRKGQYGPKPQNFCVLLVDDLNMPTKEKYGAQPPIQLVRQYLDQGGWYEHKDKDKPFKKIINTILVTAMGPPGGGRSFVTPRILRHLSLTSLTSFEDETLNRIFSTILKWFFTTFNFNADILKTEPKIFTSTLEIYKSAMEQFLPTPTKSHYLFNLRDFARVIFGICMSDKEKLQTTEQAVRLWMHEILRVFSDRLINEEDRLNLFNIAKNTVNRVWQLNFDKVFEHLDKTINGVKDAKITTLEQIRGLLWTDTMSPLGARKVYEEVIDPTRLQKAVEQSLVNYNNTTDKPMDLVLFSFAVQHLLTIARIIKQPTGNACLVGVGGSGRQSLTRLATQISEYEIFQIQITKTYGKLQWKQDLKKILKQSGGKNLPTVFLFTDSEIKDESFVEDVNNLLNTYEVPNLFSTEEKAELMQLVRPVAKAENKAKEGTPAQLYSFFVEKCKKNLHIVLAFSPIGDAFRTRVRMFPSIVNCCTIDWFQDWPQDALLWLARKFLGSIEMEETIRQKCVEMVQFYHSSTSKWSKKFLSKLKRHYYVTPTSYIELITTFKKLLDEKRKEINADIFKYENGYEKIIQTEQSVDGMRKNLIELQPKLKQAAIDTEVKMKQVQENKASADVLKEGIEAEQKIVKSAVDAANKIKSECEHDLAEAMPALKAAEDALKVLDKKQLDLLKAMKKPPNVIRVVMKALCLLMYPNPTQKTKNNETLKMEVDWWAASMKLLGNPKLLDELLDYKIENAEESIINNLGKYLNDPENVPNLKVEVVENASTACKCMIMWINGSYNFYHVNKKVKPKKIALAASEAEVKQLSAKLAEKQKHLKAAVDKVTALNDELESTIRYKEKLEKQYEECSKQLERAVKLIDSLGGQKGRWGELAAELKITYQNLTGDILVSSGMIAYLGAFTAAFRTQIVEQWVTQTKEKQIPSSQNFSLVHILGNPVQMRQWNIDGLPSDNFSLENGIVIFKSRRWPLCIDPQGQANKWIKKMEMSRKINVIKLSDPNFLRTLENAIQFGQPVLLENVGEQLDPALNPILLKQTYQKGTTVYMKLGDQIIEYSSKFIFYITTKYRNPHYLPQISTKVTLINFMITYEGLNDQLLGIIVKKERPDLQEQKERLILEGAANQKELFEIEQQILKVLSSDKNILLDQEAINILTASKEKSTQIKEKQQIATITEKNIDSARQEYKPVSQEAACLFFAISDLGNIDPMYQYSLTYYIQLFTMSIVKSQKSPNLTLRLKNLKNYFLYSLYSNICRSLFEKDKLLLSFLLCTRLAQFKNEISNEGLRFLLTGGVALTDYLPEKPKKGDWISQKSWGQIYRLSQMERFDIVLKSITDHVDDWKKIYDSKEPQSQKMPQGIESVFTQFDKLLILRTIRPDKMIPAVQNYVVSELGQKFISPPPFDLAKIYADSNSVSPLIFILSPGSDPFVSLSSFAQSKKKAIKPISLGQGQGPVAEKMIQEGQKTGDWVVLQNCHLAVTWMPILERICQQISPDPQITKPDFRLWLTSYPSDKFPTAILQNGVKMTNEPPKGLKANLTGSYLTDPISSEQFFEGNKNQPENFKVLIYALSFFHAVIQERRKYGPLGWNIPYEFNESDLRISVRQLKMFSDQNDKIPFPALKYLIAECNYGGRVTDDKDRRLIVTLLSDYFNDSVLEDKNYKFGPNDICKPVKLNEHQQYLDHIQTLPHLIHPNVFGFHSNADITKDINETNLLLESVLLCSTESGGVQGQSAQQILERLVQSILGDFPEPFDVTAVMEKYPVSYKESMNTVLTQELQRFNGLIKIIRSSLKDLKLAMVGKIVMNASLEAASKSLFNGKVPDLWMSKSYPSLKPLGSYVADLKARLAFFQKWIDVGYPTVFWISGFFFTQSFLTGVLQNFARKYTIPIDQILYDFEFLKEQPDMKPEDGAYVNGLFLEGCRWSYDTMKLDESEPKILFTKCPHILMKPSHNSKLTNYKNYKCPVYKTSARRGVLSTTGHSTNFVMFIRLPTELEESHWIKRGVALLTQLDD